MALFRTLLIMGALLAPVADDGAPGGTGGAPPPPGTPPPAPPPAPAPRTVDVERLEARASEKARKALLDELGIDDPATAKVALEEAKAARAAKLSADERAAAALTDATTKATKLQAKLDAAEKERDAHSTALTLIKAGVQPGEVDYVAFQHEKARAGKDFDEAKWLTELRAEKPYLFAPAADPKAPANAADTRAPATTTPPRQPAPSPYGNGPPGQTPQFDALTATPEQLREFRLANPNISRPS